MNLMRWLAVLSLLVLPTQVARADGVSFTGSLATPESPVDVILNLSAPSTITLQTYGFGGGTNQAGKTISPGGTDPFLAIFAGTGPGATILTDGSSKPFSTSLDLGNYGGFMGCPAAGTVTWGGAAVCGDITMTLPGLAAGTYTIALTDGQYIANAVFDNGTLGEGFSDFSGGVFCNLVDGSNVPCPNTSGAFALDVTGLSRGSTTTIVPEPTTLLLVGSGLLGLGWQNRRHASRGKVPTGKTSS